MGACPSCPFNDFQNDVCISGVHNEKSELNISSLLRMLLFTQQRVYKKHIYLKFLIFYQPNIKRTTNCIKFLPLPAVKLYQILSWPTRDRIDIPEMALRARVPSIRPSIKPQQHSIFEVSGEG